MQKILVYIIIFISVGISISNSYASVLYTTPADFPVPEKLIVRWTESVSGAGENEFREALSDFNKKNYIIALKQFEKMIIDYPDSEAVSIASLYAGSIYMWIALKDGEKDQKMLMNALKSFQYGIRTCPEKEKKQIPEILLEIGKVYIELNMVAEAKGSFNRVIREFPSTLYAAKAQYMLAVTNIKEGNFSDALSNLNLLMFKYNRGMEKERVFLTGEIFFKINEFGDSKKYFDEGLRRWPAYVKGNPDILHDYSECQFQNGEIIKAREGFLTLYNLYPADKLAGAALKRAGETFSLARNIPVAEKILLDVITFYPESDNAYASMLILGDLKFQSDSPAKSTENVTSKSEDIFNQDSLKYYKNVEKLSDNNVLVDMARFKTARVLEQHGKYQQAFNVYNKLMGHADKSLNSEVSESLSNAINRIGLQIRERLDRGDKPGVLKLYQAYYKNNLQHVKDEILLMDIASMLEGIHLYKDAHIIYNDVRGRDGSIREQALFKAGKLFARSGDDRKSVDLLNLFISEYPKSRMAPEAMALAGYGLYNIKEYDKAANHLYAVIRNTPYRYPDVYIKLGTILQERGQYEDSVAILKDMLGGVSKHSDIDTISRGYIVLGNAYYEMQRYQEALNAYRAGANGADERDGDEAVEFMIGDCLFRLGKADEAKRVFSRLSAGKNDLIKQVSEEKLKDIAFAGNNLSL